MTKKCKQKFNSSPMSSIGLFKQKERENVLKVIK